MQDLRQGTRLADRYTLTERLGAGGMGSTWLAQDDRAGSKVALKFLDESLAADPARRDLFRKEWQTASRLMHAHIARVFEYHDEERPYYALQYVDGPDLGVLAGSPLSAFMPAVGLLADALRYAHGKGVVHRDIKAANVLLDRSGSPYLIDFGLVGTDTGGTPASASPERLQGKPPGPADDIYALGVLVHELVYGAPPTGELAAARPTGERVPDKLVSLIEAMLASDPASRPSAEQVCDRLHAAGFPRAAARLPAELRRVRGHERDTEVRIQSVRPAAAAGPRPQAGQPVPGQGVSANLVYAGLAALLLVLVGVTFLLPDTVDREAPVVAPPAPEPDTRAADTVDDSANSGETRAVTPGAGIDGGAAGFSENLGQTSTDPRLQAKFAADEALGNLLSIHERLKYRGIERWGGQAYLDALDVYAQGDEAYIANNYGTAADRYRRTAEMLDPFFDRIDSEFRNAMDGASAAFERRDPVEAIRLYDLAVAITPGNAAATAGLERARSLGNVLDLMQQGRRYLDDLQLDAARLAFEKALELDPQWEPAREALDSVRARITQQSFESRMTEGFSALSADDFATARAAFEAAKKIFPDSPEPGDGLLQVDQAERLYRIRVMEREAAEQEANEEWETAVATYQALLDVDGDLAFAKEGLARARARAAMHRQLQDYIDDPDSLSDPVNMQKATQLMLGITRMEDVGPRLEDHKDTLARLLKRAATPLTVELVSDNATEVSIYKVGRLGSFARRELELRPGEYVAVGIRPGFRDVRREFRVAPEIDLQPIVVQCEEPI